MKIYVLGDSISIHYGPFLDRFLQGIMEYSRKDEESLPNLDPPQGEINLDPPQRASGGDSSMVLRFLKAKTQFGGIAADLLLLNCGLHDIRTNPESGAKQISIGQYKENLRAIIDTVAGMKLELIWIRTTPCDEAVHNRGSVNFYRFPVDCKAYNYAADQIMAEAGVPSIDLYTFTLNLGPDLFCDHVHFHEHIREKQGAFIAGWLAAFKENTVAQAIRQGDA